MNFDPKKLDEVVEYAKHKPRRTIFLLLLSMLLILVFTAWGTFLDSFFKKPRAEPARTLITDVRFAETLRNRPQIERDLKSPSGPPLRAVVSFQPFEEGFMIWLSDEPSVIIVCTEPPKELCKKYPHVSLSKHEEEIFSSFPREVSEKFNPTGGFRTTWIRFDLRPILGLPLVSERAFDITVQRFEGGLLIKGLPPFRRSDRKFVHLPKVVPILGIWASDGSFEWEFLGQPL